VLKYVDIANTNSAFFAYDFGGTNTTICPRVALDTKLIL
jgi:hypothetical protein